MSLSRRAMLFGLMSAPIAASSPATRTIEVHALDAATASTFFENSGPAIARALRCGLITPNEVRVAEGLPPIAGQPT